MRKVRRVMYEGDLPKLVARFVQELPVMYERWTILKSDLL